MIDLKRRTLLKYLGTWVGSEASAGLRGSVAFAAQAPASQAAASQAPAAASGPAAPAFLFNQLGFLPGEAKGAVVRGAPGGMTEFRLLSAGTGAVAYKGMLTAPSLDDASGDSVQRAVFTAVTTPGLYLLEAGAARSQPFAIQANLYAEALHGTVHAFTGQRCGCAVDLGSGYKHPPCHARGEFHGSSGKSGTLPNTGGWHDAGDYGRYVVNSGITCGTLLWAWELFPEPLRPLNLTIAKTNPVLPDYLEEIKWNLEWMLSMQDTDGGVFHKQTSTQFCAFVMPQDDRLASEVIGTGAKPYKSTCATADLAAVMAIAARCFADFSPLIAKRFVAAARSAWQWASDHPDVPFRNPPGVLTGEYGDPHCADELLWAAAELWRTTGEQPFRKAFLDQLAAKPGPLSIETPGWNNLQSMALWTFALAPSEEDDDLKATIRAASVAAATHFVARSQANGYGNTLSLTDYVWGSNAVAANQSLLLCMAHHLQPSETFASVALGNLDYLLGRNCHGVSWVTQIGTRPFLHPHHRPSAADGIALPWPGLLSGGPNRRPSDKVANTLPAAPPMRMWVDDQEAYSVNEVAINWNAPLVFLLAFANQRAMQA